MSLILDKWKYSTLQLSWENSHFVDRDDLTIKCSILELFEIFAVANMSNAYDFTISESPLTCSFRRKSPTAFLPTELIFVLSSLRSTSGLPSSPVFLVMVTSPFPASNMTRRIQNRACICACLQAPVSGLKNSRDNNPARAMFNQFT